MNETASELSELNADEEFKLYLLAQTRAAIIRLKMQINQLTTVGVGLKSGVISTEQAITDLYKGGLLVKIAPYPPEPAAEADGYS